MDLIHPPIALRAGHAKQERLTFDRALQNCMLYLSRFALHERPKTLLLIERPGSTTTISLDPLLRIQAAAPPSLRGSVLSQCRSRFAKAAPAFVILLRYRKRRAATDFDDDRRDMSFKESQALERVKTKPNEETQLTALTASFRLSQWVTAD